MLRRPIAPVNLPPRQARCKPLTPRIPPFMGLFAACYHAISNLVTMNMNVKLGLEIAACTFLGWLLAGIAIDIVYKPAMSIAR